MRTGIKTLYKKIHSYINFPDQFIQMGTDVFPEQGLPWWKITAKIHSLKNTVRIISARPRLNEIHNSPHSIALRVWRALLPYNPNNLGNFSTPRTHDVIGTQKTERTLVHLMIRLYGGKPHEWEGYVTGGATDSNLYAMWLGRSKLQEWCDSKTICVLQNDLTHYSIPKSANLLNIKTYSTGLHPKDWSFDSPALQRTILQLHRKGMKGFILPLTLGYAQTGTSDSTSEILTVLSGLQKKLGIRSYVFIDAALNGLTMPFTSNTFYPLREKQVDSINVDFHKFGMVPFSCGLVLYRKTLRNAIQLQVPFLGEGDSTLNGSRSGISPASALMVVHAMGKEGFTRAVKKSLANKNEFIAVCKKQFPSVELVNDPESLTVGIITPRALPKSFLDRYGLYAQKQRYHFPRESKMLFIYKATFISA